MAKLLGLRAGDRALPLALARLAEDAILVVTGDSPVYWTPEATYEFAPDLTDDAVARFGLVQVQLG